MSVNIFCISFKVTMTSRVWELFDRDKPPQYRVLIVKLFFEAFFIALKLWPADDFFFFFSALKHVLHPVSFYFRIRLIRAFFPLLCLLLLSPSSDVFMFRLINIELPERPGTRSVDGWRFKFLCKTPHGSWSYIVVQSSDKLHVCINHSLCFCFTRPRGHLSCICFPPLCTTYAVIDASFEERNRKQRGYWVEVINKREKKLRKERQDEGKSREREKWCAVNFDRV